MINEKKQTQQIYDEHIDAIMIENDVIEVYRMEGEIDGEKKGMKKGIEIGEKKKAFAVAKKMKKKGVDIDTIKEFTDLTDNEIEDIQIDD